MLTRPMKVSQFAFLNCDYDVKHDTATAAGGGGGSGVQAGSPGLARQSLPRPAYFDRTGITTCAAFAKPASSSPHLWRLLIPVASPCPVIPTGGSRGLVQRQQVFV